MDRFDRINNFYRLFVATVVSAIAALILDRLEQIFKERSIVWTVLLGLVAAAIFLLNQLFESVLEMSKSIRKIIAGDEYIEGYWFDISVDRVNKVVHHGSFITIWWENGRFVVNGIEFDPHGNRISTFRSTSSSYANRVLTFGYESHSESFNQALETGIDQLQFDNPPQSYNGFYFDFTKTVDFRIHGSRIDRKIIEEHDRFRDVTARRKFIMAQIAETKKKLMAETAA